MATSNKRFDAVRMMRSIRDKLSEQISGMTFEEEQAYIRLRLRDEPADGNFAAFQEQQIVGSGQWSGRAVARFHLFSGSAISRHPDPTKEEWEDVNYRVLPVIS